MPTRISKLVIKDFRGATCPVELEFDVTKPAVLIFGENGTGKSTLVDAIDFVCNQKFGSLTERSSISPKSHLPALGRKANDISITLSSEDNSWTGVMGKDHPQYSGTAIPPPRARILRRSQILTLVNAQPKARYDALRGFIEVPAVEKSECALGEAVNEAKRDYDEAVRARAQAEEALHKYWSAEGSPPPGHIPWAEARAREDAGALQGSGQNATAILNLVAALDQASANLDRCASEYAATTRQLERAAAELKRAEDEGSEQDRELLAVLKDARTYLAKHASANTCPVCEQRIVTANVLNRIEQRLSSMAAVTTAKTGIDTAERNHKVAEGALNRSRQAFVGAAARAGRELRASLLAPIAAENQAWDKYQALLMPETVVTMETMEQSVNILAVGAKIRTALTTLRDDAQKRTSQLSGIKTQLQTIDEKTRASEEAKDLYDRLAELSTIVASRRKEYVEGVLTAISSSVEALYGRLHPGEGIGQIKLYLRANVKGSLEFDAAFQGQTDVPPQAYYSESHLDTLGVCVFLALAKHFNDGNTIVVLDDVVTSVDEAHMDRFIQVLHDEATNFGQLVVATHYRPWRDRYRFALGPAGNVQLIELLHWSLPRGIRHTRTKLALDDLEGHVETEPMDRQIVASKAGVLLESLLDHLALVYRCKLPRQPRPDYTLGDLLGCIGKKLKKGLKIEKLANDGTVGLTHELESPLNELRGTAWVRNQVGCHWSFDGSSVADPEVKAFGTRTIALGRVLICDQCGQLPLKNKTGGYWQCACGRTHLTPVDNPDL
ncbi:MAG: AAA family ATPase [Acidobacteriota bacterium]